MLRRFSIAGIGRRRRVRKNIVYSRDKAVDRAVQLGLLLRLEKLIGDLQARQYRNLEGIRGPHRRLDFRRTFLKVIDNALKILGVLVRLNTKGCPE